MVLVELVFSFRVKYIPTSFNLLIYSVHIYKIMLFYLKFRYAVGEFDLVPNLGFTYMMLNR